MVYKATIADGCTTYTMRLYADTLTNAYRLATIHCRRFGHTVRRVAGAGVCAAA